MLGYAQETRKIATLHGPRLFCRTTQALLVVIDVILTKKIYKNETFGFLFFYKWPERGLRNWSLFPKQVSRGKVYLILKLKIYNTYWQLRFAGSSLQFRIQFSKYGS